jgi:hypothetical protein
MTYSTHPQNRPADFLLQQPVPHQKPSRRTSHDEDTPGVVMVQHGRVHQALMIHSLIRFSALDLAIQQQHLENMKGSLAFRLHCAGQCSDVYPCAPYVTSAAAPCQTAP